MIHYDDTDFNDLQSDVFILEMKVENLEIENEAMQKKYEELYNDIQQLKKHDVYQLDNVEGC